MILLYQGGLMSIFVTILLFVLGLILIIKGGDYFVEAASWMALVSGIPRFVIGATVVSLATTLPELLVSLLAALDGKVDLAVGNAVGSVTANIGFIMALSIICLPGVFYRRQMAFKSFLMVLAAFLPLFFSGSGYLPHSAAWCMLLIFVAFIIDSLRTAKAGLDKDNGAGVSGSVFGNILRFILGAAGIVLGAEILVKYGSELAVFFGVSEAVIGVSLVAMGTSLPELVTTLTAIKKGESALSIGNILGANILDLTLIMPVCALVSGEALPVSRQGLILDLPVCLLICFLAVAPAFCRRRFSRGQGFCLLVIYIAYLVVIFGGFGDIFG
jgi:cation:H+ antiporter